MPTQKFQLEKQEVSSTALVAGGAGLVGSYLCQQLLEQGSRVICLDNFTTGRRENIAHLEGREGFVLLEHDLAQPLPEGIPSVDYIFHLAGLQEAYVGHSLETLLVNSAGTQNLLQFAQRAGAKVLLASTPEVFSAAISQTSLAKYFGGSAEEAARYTHHEAKRFAEALLAQYSREKKLNARIVRLGHIFGPRMNLARKSKIGQLFVPAVSGQPLPVPGDGLERVYLLHAQDAARGLMAAMFSPATSGEVFTLGPAQGLSFFDLASQVKRLLDPEPEIIFVPGEAEESLEFIAEEIDRSQKKLSWQPEVELQEGIIQTLKWAQEKLLSPTEEKKETRKTVEVVEDKAPLAKKTRPVWTKFIPRLTGPSLKLPRPRLPSGRPAKVGLGLFLLIIVLLLPFLNFIANGWWGAVKLTRAEKSLLAGQASKAAAESNDAAASFSRSQTTLHFFSPALSLLGLRQQTIQADKILGLAEGLAKTINHAGLATAEGMVLAGQVLGQDEADLEQTIAAAHFELSQVAQEISFLEAEFRALSQVKASSLWGVGGQFTRAQSQLGQVKDLVAKGQAGILLVPQILGNGDVGPKTYLILFQNNTELRPTGGFIGSYGLVTFDRGKLTDFSVYDVYAADGQLKGHVEPPEAIKRYLGEAGWYLRDSNWEPDFPVSAARAAWFLEKETGQVVDGVVGINLYFAQKLLEATGPIELADYGETITADNLFERAEFHSEANFFPGSTQKRDFLASLAAALFERVRLADATLLAHLARALYLSLEEKEVLIYFTNPAAQELVAQSGWAGALRTPVCSPDRECASDYLAVFEANVGVNKANFFVSRRIVHGVEIGPEGSVSAQLRIDYDNRSPSQTWPAGRYKNFLRLFLPEGAVLEEVKVGEKEIEEEEIMVETSAGRTSFGFLVEVPIKSSRQVKISFRPPARVATGAAEASYLLLFQKQSGTGKTPLFLTVKYPEFFLPLATSGAVQEAGGELLFSQELDSDEIFKIDFARI